MSKSDQQAQALLLEALTRHDVHLHRVGSRITNRVTEQFDNLSSTMLTELSQRLDGLTAGELLALSRGKYHTSRLKGIKRLIDDWSAQTSSAMAGLFAEEATELAGAEFGYMAALLGKVIADAPEVDAQAAAVYRAAKETPVLGHFVESMLAEIPEQTKKQVYSAVRQGVSDGTTTDQIIRNLRGTRALKYKDGTLQTSRRHIDAVVRTGTNHVSSIAQAETYESLGVTEVMDVATLDGRVTAQCAGYDGRKHKASEPHPMPPYHMRCRTRQVPVIASMSLARRPYVAAFTPVSKIPKDERGDIIGRVKATTKFPQWFDTQSAAFQREWLGETRYKLFKQGGYKLDRFIDPAGKELTLEQLKSKDAATFAELFGT